MRLEQLCEFVLSYDDLGLTVVKPFGGYEGQGYGTGFGDAVGERLSGPVRWSNYPRMTDDGVLLPDARGVITTAEGPVLFEFHGSSIPVSPGSTTRRVTASVVFRTEAEEHRWLNHAVVVQEGAIDFTTMSLRLPTFVCLPD